MTTAEKSHSETSPLLEAALNLSRCHREHEEFYAGQPREQAVMLQRHVRTLLALADRWTTTTISSRSVVNPYEGADDLNSGVAVQLDGVLFMEGEGEPAEIRRLKSEISRVADELGETGRWLTEAMHASWEIAPALVDVPELADVLGERHRIIANDWLAGDMSAMAARVLRRARSTCSIASRSHLPRCGAILRSLDAAPRCSTRLRRWSPMPPTSSAPPRAWYRTTSVAGACSGRGWPPFRSKRTLPASNRRGRARRGERRPLSGRSALPRRPSVGACSSRRRRSRARGVAMAFHVDSEVGRLRRVMLHRPGLELQRLTPANCAELLFDDVLWVKRARQEHDGLRRRARATAASRCCTSQDLLAETLADDTARKWVLERTVTDHDARADARSARARPPRDTRSRRSSRGALIGGVVASDLPGGARTRVGDAGSKSDLVLAPLPNHLFTRDTSCWIYGGVSLNPMAKPARRRETVHLEAIYRFHPRFVAANVRASGTAASTTHWGRATLEGGDVLVIGERRGAHRHGRAHDAVRGRAARAAAVRARCSARDHRGRAAEGPLVHAPRHGDDDDRP